MSSITFADVVHNSISFSREVPSESVLLDLIDTAWVQRLRDISQTANTRLVYMFSEHSRFGHCLGVAHLANLVMEKLSKDFGAEVQKYRIAVSAASLLHDIGHLAPGSHTAFKTWFPDQPDTHEELAVRVLSEDKDIQKILSSYGANTPWLVAAILMEDKSVPPWTWEIISGGGWNVDRGNWCIVDSIMAGVNYGRYNIPALIESIVITPDGHLALKENRLDAMMHFAVSRHAMYRQMYQHRVLLAADVINRAIAQRARDLGASLEFLDDWMKAVLQAKTPAEIPLSTIFSMRESWWRYHLDRWRYSQDKILADLSTRLLDRRLFKTVRLIENEDTAALFAEAERAVRKANYDPAYYLHHVSSIDVHAGDSKQSMQILLDNGKVSSLPEAEPLMNAMLKEAASYRRSWLVMPKEAKIELGRER